MKRLIVFVLSLMMAVTFGFTWTTADASAVGKGMIGDQGKTQSQEQEYAKHQAIVMFKDGKVEMVQKHTQYNTESLAKFAFSIFWQAVKHARKHGTMIILDY